MEGELGIVLLACCLDRPNLPKHQRNALRKRNSTGLSEGIAINTSGAASWDASRHLLDRLTVQSQSKKILNRCAHCAKAFLIKRSQCSRSCTNGNELASLIVPHPFGLEVRKDALLRSVHRVRYVVTCMGLRTR